MDIICFHNPDEDNGYLSNWYPSSFTVDGVAFSSMEQFMMYRKAICFGDEAVATQILSTSDVAKIKSLGRQVSNYDESMWNGIRQIVVYEGLLAKFSQNEELKGKLKATENAVLAECAVKDCIWGIGLSMKDPDRLNKAKWNGQNLLGYALMMVRERLQQDYSWEQRKVTEIGKIYIGLVTTMTKHYTDEGTLLIRNSDIKDGKFEFGDNPIHLEKLFAEKNETRMHQIGDVITVHTGDVGTSAVITENEAKSIGFATIVTRPNPKIIDSNYLCSFLNTDKHKKWAVSISTGDGRTNYNLGDYFELVVPVPSIAEQKKIAAYIQNLNRLITLHQRELYKHLRYRILKVRRKS